MCNILPNHLVLSTGLEDRFLEVLDSSAKLFHHKYIFCKQGHLPPLKKKAYGKIMMAAHIKETSGYFSPSSFILINSISVK